MPNSTNGNDVPVEALAYRGKYAGPTGRAYRFIDPDAMCLCGYRGRDHNAKGDCLMAGSHCRNYQAAPAPELEPEE